MLVIRSLAPINSEASTSLDSVLVSLPNVLLDVVRNAALCWSGSVSVLSGGGIRIVRLQDDIVGDGIYPSCTFYFGMLMSWTFRNTSSESVIVLTWSLGLGLKRQVWGLEGYYSASLLTCVAKLVT